MKAPTFLASLVYLTAVLSYPLSDKSGGAKGLTDEYVNITVTDTTQGFHKRQNQQALSLVMDAISGAANNLNNQDDSRKQFANDLVSALWSGNKHYNYIACHVAHSYDFQGKQSIDWDHQYVEAHTGPSYSRHKYTFDVVVGGAGTFLLQGEGGDINWFYKGYVSSKQEVGKDTLVTFTAPP